jgi:hypothetical protein
MLLTLSAVESVAHMISEHCEYSRATAQGICNGSEALSVSHCVIAVLWCDDYTRVVAAVCIHNGVVLQYTMLKCADYKRLPLSVCSVVALAVLAR